MPRIGVNYVPSDGWWYSWVDWNRISIDADLRAIKALGTDHIRIHCLWPLFQPNPTLVSERMLGRLVELLDSAERAGLDVIVTVFNGWLSGFDFRPTWLVPGANIFTDDSARRAEKLLLGRLIQRIHAHPAFLGIDIGNEPNVLSTEKVNPTSGTQGADWSTDLLELCETLAPGKVHSVGVDHNPWLTDETSFDRFRLGEIGAASAVHSWSYFTGALQRYGDSGTGTIHLAEFMLELARAFHTDSSRPVWLQEVGVSLSWLDTIDVPTFVERTLATLPGVNNLWGVTWWCSHDVSRALEGFEDLEYDLGLLTVTNEVKPMGAAFREFVEKTSWDAPQPRTTGLLLPTGTTPDLQFADKFFGLIDSGIKPAIVVEQYSSSAHLDRRGITQLLHE